MFRQGDECGSEHTREDEPLAFEWHPIKAASNLKKHGVSFEEAATSFKDERRLEVPDQWHSDDEERYLSIGRSTEGRVLKTYYTQRGKDSHYQLAAIRAMGKEAI